LETSSKKQRIKRKGEPQKYIGELHLASDTRKSKTAMLPFEIAF
jgi:hypothetical protein